MTCCDCEVDSEGLEPSKRRIESLASLLACPSFIRGALAGILLANVICGLDTDSAQILAQVILPLA